MSWLNISFAYVLNIINNLVNNYGLAIILFSLFTKLIMLPLTIKSQKSMNEMNKINPLLQELNVRYKDDKQKLAVETQKLYKEHNVSPLGGCLPMLVQIILIFPIYAVVQKPLTYLLNIGDKVEEIKHLLFSQGVEFANTIQQSQLLALAKANIDKLQELGPEIINKLNSVNSNFLGMDVGKTPIDAISANPLTIYWLIPITILAFSILSQQMMMKKQKETIKKRNEENEKKNKKPKSVEEATMQDNVSTNAMMKIMPFMTAFISLSLTTAIGFYWAIGNIAQVLTQVYVEYRFQDKEDAGKPTEKKLKEAKTK